MTHTRLYLIRHGQVIGHEERRYNGQGDVLLTALGKQQAQAMSQCLAGARLSAVVSSDLERCAYGGKLIADAHNLPIRLDPALRELHVGRWEGHTWDELKTIYPQEWRARLQDLVNYRIPGGESLQDAADRVRPALQALLKEFWGGQIVLVAHGGVNRIILLDAIGAPLDCAFAIEQDYGCLNIIDYFADDNSVVRLLNSLPDRTRICDR